LVVGLGNPGSRYEGTRHNVGFAVVDHLGSGADPFSTRFHGLFSTFRVAGSGDGKVALLKPQTFMNRSGQSVRAAMDFYKVSIDDLLVIHDELDLPLGTVRLKQGGGEAGHNGLRSISQHVGGQGYARLRVGIGRPPPDFRGGVADFVLQAFPPEASGDLTSVIEQSARVVHSLATDPIQAVMNEVNRKR